MNNLYLTVLPKGKAYDYKFVYTTEHPCFFDEHCGMERIMKYNNEGLYRWSMGLKTGILANISPFSYRFDFTYKGEVLKDVYFEYDNGALTLHSHNIVLPVVYAHFAKRQFEGAEEVMVNFQSIEPLWAVQTAADSAVDTTSQNRTQPSMFSDIFQSMVDSVKETDAAKNEAYYALATGQLDNPAVASIAATQAELSASLLIQMRNKALEAYNELMRISM